MQQSFTTPDTHNSHMLRIVTVNNSKRRMNQLQEEELLELGNYPAYVMMIDKPLDPLKALSYQPFTHMRHALPRTPGLDLLEIAQRRLREADNNPRHCSISIPAASRLPQGKLLVLPPDPHTPPRLLA